MLKVTPKNSTVNKITLLLTLNVKVHFVETLK